MCLRLHICSLDFYAHKLQHNCIESWLVFVFCFFYIL